MTDEQTLADFLETTMRQYWFGIGDTNVNWTKYPRCGDYLAEKLAERLEHD